MLGVLVAAPRGGTLAACAAMSGSSSAPPSQLCLNVLQPAGWLADDDRGAAAHASGAKCTAEGRALVCSLLLRPSAAEGWVGEGGGM